MKKSNTTRASWKTESVKPFTLISDKLNELHQVQWKTRINHQPVQVQSMPKGWSLLGSGNYAAVFVHHEHPDWVVKMRRYTPEEEERVRAEFEDEIAVYRAIGDHPNFSALMFDSFPFLILRRLHGKTILQCMREGDRVHPHHIRQIDHALAYAQSCGLFPHDVHIKNIMIDGDQAYIADVSDFRKSEPCRLWDDCKRFYWFAYFPFVYPLGFAVSDRFLNWMKGVYRTWVPYEKR